MEIGLIGLGKMGMMLLSNMREHGIHVYAHDRESELEKEAKSYGAHFYHEMDELVNEMKGRKVIWLMLPAGEVTEEVFRKILERLSEGDVIIDGGNAHYRDSIRRYETSKTKGIHFFDVGTSGGVEGARNGSCMMIGGDSDVFTYIEPIFEAVNVQNGYLYTGESGSGHFLKMIHNGIEYGMMQSIGEGFNLLHKSHYEYDLEKVAGVFNHGSVIRSWLMELTESLLSEDPKLTQVEGVIPSSGEGKWALEEALNLRVSIPVIAQSVMVRYASEDNEKYGEKVIASLRNKFGGHDILKKEEK
ncbi:MAG TPA: decarboxylating 6-phosphogluconate dehydrogenase [Proteiniclasticum sp.]|nr:decarboxylating 6-phosphogluconate dehydrogenase [Proteiniclasticum sp.]